MKYEETIKKLMLESKKHDDPFWIEIINNIVEKIASLPSGTRFTIKKIADELYTEPELTSKELFSIYKLVIDTCEKENIVLERTGESGKVRVIGLPYNIPFIKRED